MNELIHTKVKEHFAAHPLRSYPKGQIIIFANQDPEGVYFLEEGIVEEYTITPEGNRLIVNIFKPSAFFPMSWAINLTPNIYFYSAVTDIKLRRAPADQTVEFLQSNPDVLFDLVSRVYKGTDALLKRLVLAASGIASSRLIFELLIEAYRFGVETDDGTVQVSIKQSALAARSGLARETISRELRKLKEAKLIAQTGKDFALNIKSLEKKLDLSI